PLPKNPEVTGILGVEDAFPVAQSRNHRAAAFLAEHVTVGEPKLANRLLDDLRELTRNRAEKAVTGVDDFIRGVLRALRFRWLGLRGLGRGALVLRACGLSDRGIAWRRRIGLGRQGRTCQAEQDKGESDGPRHGAHRVLHWESRIDRDR